MLQHGPQMEGENVAVHSQIRWVATKQKIKPEIENCAIIGQTIDFPEFFHQEISPCSLISLMKKLSKTVGWVTPKMVFDSEKL